MAIARSLLQVTPELWVAQSRLYQTNSGIFLSRGQACLVDPAVYPDEIEAIAQFVASQGAKPKALVVTHSHWDHILGAERFPGVPVITQEAYRQEIEGERGARTRQEIARWEAESKVGRNQPFVLPQPNQTFDGRLQLAVGNVVLNLLSAPGHAADQLVIHSPERALLWSADMLSDLEVPFISHSLVAYQATLSALSALDVQVLVPGHGHPTADTHEIRNRILEDVAYLAALRDLVEGAVRQGRSMAETAALCENMEMRYREENAGPHRRNVESVYIELGGGDAAAGVGWVE